MASKEFRAGSSPLLLSVVMISRNQLWNVSRLIESVRRECATVGPHEIVLVDSASTDGTAEEAARAGIRVIQIDGHEHLSPAAGRYVGYRATEGEFVLFLDGDAEMVEGWLGLALGLLAADPELGGVTGSRISLPLDTTERPDPPPFSSDWSAVTHSGGSALYRRAVLEEVGTFDPHLYSDEEPDLSIRLRHHGYRLARTEYPAIFDYTDPVDRIGTLWGRRSRRLYLGAGQNLRKHFGRPTFTRYLRERGFGIVPLVALPAYAGAVAAGAHRGPTALTGVLALPFVAFGLLTTRKGSAYKALHSVVLRLLIAEGTVRGLRLPVRSPEAYRPLTKEIVSGP